MSTWPLWLMLAKALWLLAWLLHCGGGRSNKEGKKREGGYPKSQRMGKEQWAMARVYGFVGKNRKQIAEGQPDRDLYLKTK